MEKKYLSIGRIAAICAVFTLVVSGSVFFLHVQTADGQKKKEEKVKEFLKFNFNMSVNWTKIAGSRPMPRNFELTPAADSR